MAKFTPFYSLVWCRKRAIAAENLAIALQSVRPLPCGQHATDSEANSKIWDRHTRLRVKAWEIAAELRSMREELEQQAAEKQGA